MSIYNYRRRESSEVRIGKIKIGANNAISLQSMTNVSTNDISECVEQSINITKAGGDIVRLTTQGVKEALNIGLIRKELRERGCETPLVADVHFNPKAAFVAAENTDKVRINPGNFVDAARTFKKLSFTEEEYSAEILKIRESLIPFLEICKKNSTAVRLGVNHGSLSDRIMSRYGDTPEGMVESVMEYLRICREVNFDQIVISIKASNTVVMVSTVRLLVESMKREGMAYPLHLGVTEAGDGEDGRVKSAVGIGTLLAEGIGDTIRVSLSEDPQNEIPVGKLLVEHITSRAGHKNIIEPKELDIIPREYALPIPGFDSIRYPLAYGVDFESIHPTWVELDASEDVGNLPSDVPIILSSKHQNKIGEIQAFIAKAINNGKHNPFIIKVSYDTASVEELQIMAGADFGAMLMNGFGTAIWLDAPNISKEDLDRISLAILQASRLRFTHTEFIACPGCGRTLFALQDTLKEIKAATSHLKGLKIGVMGCIVNGPGEMADADYGYVGAAAGKVSLYKNKECIEKNIPQEDALPRLIALIKANGDWIEP